jgi:uncharacterized protein (TIGR02594 family)
MHVMQMQRILQRLGYDPGPIDGIFGRLTAEALRAFQRKAGIPTTGLPDERTIQALLSLGGAEPDTAALVWFEEARRLMGLKKVIGPGSNRKILDMARDLDIPYPNDDVPWCGLFVAHCIATTLPREPLPNNPLGARQWLKFGTRCEPKLGAVLVFWRGSREGWMGHVAFYEGEDATHYHCLGGNQDNQVNIVRITKKRLLGARWPRAAEGVVSAAQLRPGGEGESTDEG